MKKTGVLSILTLLLTVFYKPVYGQYYAVYEDDFESSLGWTFANGGNVNHFIIGTCAGNNYPVSGTSSLLVAPLTGTGTDCSPGSEFSFNYQNASSGRDTVWAIQTIKANVCGEDLVTTFDYKLPLTDNNDRAGFAYRTSASSPWQFVQTLPNSTTWQNASYSLPSLLNGTIFEFGFYFTVDNTNNAGQPFAIDHFVIKGLDHINPTITCPTTHAVYGDATCSYLMHDLTGLASGTDNCTATNDLVFSQSPNVGITVTGTTPITFTVKDASNNSASCTTTLTMIDTIKPIVTCNSSYQITNNGNDCLYTMPDVTANVLTIQDNCSTSNFVVTQTPAAGTASIGVKTVIVEIKDEQGNIGGCLVKVSPIDTIPPTIVCPADKVVNNGTTCDFALPDYTAEAVVSDNCILSNVNQYPEGGEIIKAGIHTISLTVRDLSGNNATCSFNLEVIETEAPTFTDCPANITTCDPKVNFNIAATDNCLFAVTKTDNSGLNSGDIFPVGVTNMQYLAKDSSGNTQTCAFSVTILEAPSTPSFVTNPIEVCNESTTQIAATAPTSGTGKWSVPNGSSLTIADVNNATTSVSNLAIGNNSVIWTVSSVSCGDTAISLTIKNYTASSQATIASDTSYKCSNSELILSAQLPVNGTGKWTANDTTIITNATNHNAFVSNLVGGWHTFYYTVKNGVCPSTVDSIAVFRMPNPEIFKLPKDTLICEYSELTLEGSVPPNSVTSLWYFEQGKGTFSDENSPNTTLTNYQQGTNILVYSFSYPNCGVTNDTVIITYNMCSGNEFVFPTLITPNQDGKNDYFVIDGLNAKYPTCKVTIINRWGGVVFESEGYQAPWDGTHKGKVLPVGTYYYIIDLNTGNNDLLRGPISIIR